MIKNYLFFSVRWIGYVHSFQTAPQRQSWTSQLLLTSCVTAAACRGRWTFWCHRCRWCRSRTRDLTTECTWPTSSRGLRLARWSAIIYGQYFWAKNTEMFSVEEKYGYKKRDRPHTKLDPFVSVINCFNWLFVHIFLTAIQDAKGNGFDSRSPKN